MRTKIKNKLQDEFEYKREVLETWTDEEIWEHIYELESEGEYRFDRQLQIQIRKHAIASGYYWVITEEQISRIWSTGRKYAFKMAGVKYTAS